MLTDCLLLAVGVLMIFAAGMVVFYSLVREPQQYSQLERIAYLWPVGLTALAMPMFLLSLAGMRLSIPVVGGVVIVGGVLARLSRRVPWRVYWRTSSATKISRSPLTEFEWALLFIIIACLAARTIANLMTPMYDWDGICTWVVKSKLLFFSTLKGSWGYFHNAEFRCMNQRYPLLWPIMYTWVCSALGRWDDQAMFVINPINLIAFIIILYHAMRRSVSRPVALSIAAIAASLPASIHYASCGQGDVPLMLINGAALCCLLAWIQHRRRESILLAGFLLGGAMFTKQDGKVIFLAQMCVASASILVGSTRGERKKLIGHVALASLIAVVYIAPSLLYEHTIPFWDQYYRPLSLSTIRWRELPAFIQMQVQNLAGFFNDAGLPKWNFLWPIMALFVFTSRAPWRYPMNCVLAVFVLHAAGITIVLLAFTYAFRLSSWEFALERFTVIMLPPLWLLFANCVDEWWAIWKHPPAATPATRRTV
jgi:hypothetical protein